MHSPLLAPPDREIGAREPTAGSTGLLGEIERWDDSLSIDHPRGLGGAPVMCRQKVRVGKDRWNHVVFPSVRDQLKYRIGCVVLTGCHRMDRSDKTGGPFESLSGSTLLSGFPWLSSEARTLSLFSNAKATRYVNTAAKADRGA